MIKQQMITSNSRKTDFTQDLISSEPHNTRTLTPEEEIVYCVRVQRLMVLLETKEKLAQQLRETPSDLVLAGAANFSVSELNLLLQEGKQAQQLLVDGKQYLVLNLAQRYVHLGIELKVLIQAGNVGLEQAIATFKPAQDYDFSTYASWWIQQEMARAIALQKAPRKPVKSNRSKLEGSIQCTVQNLLVLLTPLQQTIISMHYGLQGKQPVEMGAIAEHLGLSLNRIEQIHRNAMQQLYPPTNLNCLKSSGTAHPASIQNQPLHLCLPASSL